LPVGGGFAKALGAKNKTGSATTKMAAALLHSFAIPPMIGGGYHAPPVGISLEIRPR
jgi:hypothetical protein